MLAGLDGGPHPTPFEMPASGKDPQGCRHTRNFAVECVAYGGGDRASNVLPAPRAAGRTDEQAERSAGWLSGLRRLGSYRGLIRNDRHQQSCLSSQPGFFNSFWQVLCSRCGSGRHAILEVA